MKKALATITTSGATDTCVGCCGFEGQDGATQGRAARRATPRAQIPKSEDLVTRRLASLALGLRLLFGDVFIPNYRSARAVHTLIDGLDLLATDGLEGMAAQSFERLAIGWLEVLIDGVTSGFGEFEARFNCNGTVTFVGEPNLSSRFWLEQDHREHVRRRRRSPELPIVLFEIRSSGKTFDCWSLHGAVRVLQKTKADAIEKFCMEAQKRCDARRSGAE